MNKQIFFIRTAPYTYKIKNHNLYESFNVVATRKKDISLRRDSSEYFLRNIPKVVFSIDLVFCSPTKRSIKTAKFITSKPQVFHELYEVFYSMNNFINEVEFFDADKKPNVQKARTGFVQGLINNRLQESYGQAIRRVEDILKILEQVTDGKVVVVTHGFFLKIIEAYIKDKSIKNNPRRLLKYFDGKKETFKFCEGFVVDYKNKKFVFDRYIRNRKEV